MRWKNNIAAVAAILLAHPWQVHGWNSNTYNSRSNTTVLDELTRRDVAGCPAGYTNCDNFGCIEGSDCPSTCSKRDAKSCSFSVNGVGCKWESNKCVQDVQCPINGKGECPDGCSGCGIFQCINADLECPIPCKAREKSDCKTSALYNGIGCVWNKNSCIAWDVINAMPLDKDQIKATEDLSPLASSDAADSDSESPSDSSEDPSESESESESESSDDSSDESSEDPSDESTDEPTEDSSDNDKSDTDGVDTEESNTEESDTEESDSDDEGSSDDDVAAAADKDSGSSKIPMYIGIVAGVLVLIGLISWGALYYFRKKKKNQQNAAYPDDSSHLPTYNSDDYSDYGGNDDYGNRGDYYATSYSDYPNKTSGDDYKYAKHYSSAYDPQHQSNVGGWGR